ncbi:MAG: 50S ribosomal protein L5 [Candidatus Buchananbacteria bacterium RIFCSPHIGHO2_01_FULL_39_14]|uniref:Large ribosomal subunit protein uL5 n=2 Tax=Candidatus Buchananiibacteriota TaxID=1817903 RepID=A0A1G1YPA1_9BACT|nr:MAG: 50S ribosomal protein L5 [Candidatus Buchananbacteria bacterium RIFCSPHIGHO2_01_FULL_39_14]OGY49327.1 MAG: 50S ribosomal protein L5 [Candidatus Buchananbacteria bacterium RIFCSPHIGHO2_02_FULL_39_17]OGY53636.1 MAG: 50S ribosomal protein L5 [Candidatus Buchananbacteria bacterium RIFCSPLOWO2_01_FULL_40_23b]
MNRLKEKYQKEVVPRLKVKFGYQNNLAVPKLTKVVVNVGTGQGLRDAKFNEVVEATLQRISGQRPVKVAAKKSISNFKIRQGLIVGMMVTLRGKKMYDFIDKLINVTLPRIRDFRGLDTKSVDPNGNLNIGLKENIAFPEIRSDEVEKIHGLQVSIATNAGSQEIGLELFKSLGFPFRQ